MGAPAGYLRAWATRSWTAMQCQRLSVAVHMACAAEIVCELRESSTEGA